MRGPPLWHKDKVKGKGRQQGAVKYSIQSSKWKPATCSKQSSHQTKRNNKKLTLTGFKQHTKQLAPTDPILGSENILKTGFAQKGLPSGDRKGN